MDFITRTQTWIGITLAISLMHVLPILGTVGFVYWLLYSDYWFLFALYLAWIYFDRETSRRGGRRSNTFRRLITGKWFCKYFPMTLVKTAELDPSKNYIFGYHPHGMICQGAQGNFGTEGNEVGKLFPGITMHLLSLDSYFLIPFFREMAMMGGGVSVAKESINYILSKRTGGNAAIIVPGGAREVLHSRPGINETYLNKRKGFVKLAIQNGASLVPVYTFGETDLFRQPQKWYLKVQEAVYNFTGGFPLQLLGRGIFPFALIPLRKPLTTVVGAPILVEKNVTPSQEEIDCLHEKYVIALQDLFYKHRSSSGYANSELRII